ncbi:MAG: DUF418 domain-containing protein [Candidatus Solibacter sp.]
MTARPSLAPVDATERYAVLDLLRGFALFGVLLINLLYFFRVSLFAHMVQFHSHNGWANHAIDVLAVRLVEFKSFDLFAFTFGIGVAVQWERAKIRDARVEAFLARRFLILLAFGAVHMLLISNVDILMLYALCGLCLIPLLRLPMAALALAGVAAILLPSVFSAFHGLPAEAILRAHAEDATRIYAQGVFAAILEFRWRETQDFILPLLIGIAQRTFGLMLLGAAAWRAGVIREPERYRTALLVLGILAGLIGVAMGYDLPLALAYACVILMWQRSARAGAIVAPFAAAGRMAFTNYLTQSLILALLFYGYGFGLFGQLDPAAGLLITLALYAAQLWFSTWWLRRYRFGPLEWLWRSLAYGGRQPM